MFREFVQVEMISSIVRPRRREGAGRGWTDALALALLPLLPGCVCAVVELAVAVAGAAGVLVLVEAAGLVPKRGGWGVVVASFFSPAAGPCAAPRENPLEAAGFAGSSFFSAGLPKEKPPVAGAFAASSFFSACAPPNEKPPAAGGLAASSFFSAGLPNEKPPAAGAAPACDGAASPVGAEVPLLASLPVCPGGLKPPRLNPPLAAGVDETGGVAAPAGFPNRLVLGAVAAGAAVVVVPEAAGVAAG